MTRDPKVEPRTGDAVEYHGRTYSVISTRGGIVKYWLKIGHQFVGSQNRTLAEWQAIFEEAR